MLLYHFEGENGTPSLFVTGSCAEFHGPELLERLEERIYIATNGVVEIRKDYARRYQAAQDYSVGFQEFSRETLELYIKEVLIPVFGVNRYW